MPKALLPLPAAVALSAWLFACDGGGPVSGPPAVDEGKWILDNERTLDDFPFSEAGCRETFPAGSAHTDTIPAGSAAWVRIVSTACYHVSVQVENGEGDTVAFFESRFGIFHRTDEEKNRGVPGYVSWDGMDAEGRPAPRGRYLWRMEFDFGSDRILRYRADIILP